MVRFIIIRHGFSQGNKGGYFSGQLDLPLDADGVLQGRMTSEYVRRNYKVDAVYSSDLCRAVDTVKPLCDALGLPIITTSELRELHVGQWQGMYPHEIEEKYPLEYAKYKAEAGKYRFIGGESYADLTLRAVAFFDRIAAENDGKTIVVGSHGGVVRSVIAAWQGISAEEIHNVPQVPNGSVTVAEYDSGKYTLTSVGYNGHLDVSLRGKTGALDGSVKLL